MKEEGNHAAEIIRKRRELGTALELGGLQIENSIKDGFVVVRYKKMDLEKKEILGGRMQMCLPKEMEPMEEGRAARQYAGGRRPEYLYLEEEGGAVLSFHLVEGEVSEEGLERVRDLFAREVRWLYPASRIEEEETIPAGGKKICMFSYCVRLPDGEAYEVVFFLELGGCLVQGGFHCPVFQKEDWSPILKQLLATMEEMPEEGAGGWIQKG